MLPHLANLTRWEWFKLRRRMMPWTLLLILVLFSQMFIWGTFFSYQNELGSGPGVMFGVNGMQFSCTEVMAGEVPATVQQETLEQWRAQCRAAEAQQQLRLSQTRSLFTLPGSLENVLGIAQSFGLVLIAILAASNIGTDYGWGTLRTVLVRGTGRWQYLASKLLLLALLAGAALLVISAVALLTSALAGVLASGPAPPQSSNDWGNSLVVFAKAWFSLLPYLALATLVTVLTASSAAGMAVTLGYHFGEQILVAIFLLFFGDWFEAVAEFLLGRNIAAWMMDDGGAGAGMIIGGGAFGPYPETGQAFIVLLVYIVALSGLAFWRFQKRDVAGASGT